ncbi:hypothetical protein B0O99DRAFT_589546 [Bisporella sp. PMI_857]|nr:hypothetical protein B0O99DRAFT_589546 [Bisporella sp. PMI_857]
MANYTDFHGSQQPLEEWIDLPQIPGSFLCEPPAAQQNGGHGSTVNDYSLVSNLEAQSDSSQNFNSYPQSSSNSFAAIDMSTIIESTEPGGVTTQLRCRFPSCSEEREFSTESALRKHEDKHNKPYICGVPGCKHSRFGDKGGLDRHKREVHGSMTYCCPIITCKRHTEGFRRKYNLFEHQKRCHPGQSPYTELVSVQRSQNPRNLELEGTEEIRDKDDAAPSPEMIGTRDFDRSRSGRLQQKLESLYAQRVEIDSKINAVKRTMDILDEDSS